MSLLLAKTLPRPILAGLGVVWSDFNTPQDSRVSAPQRGPQQIQFTLSQDMVQPAGPGGQQILLKAGQSIMLAVNPSDTSNQNIELDTWLGGYANYGFVADRVSPVVLVNQERALRRDFSKENVFEVVETETGRGGAIKEVTHSTEKVAYETKEHALAAFVPYAAEVEAVKLYNVKAAHAKLIADKMALAREVRVLGRLTDTASWHADNYTSLTTNFKWNTGSTKNPRYDLQARIEASLTDVTGILMNPTVLFWLLSDAEVRSSMRQMMGDAAADRALAEAAAMKRVETVYLTGFPPITTAPAKKQVGAVKSYILGDDVVFLSQPSAGTPIDGATMATGYTFRTRGRSGSGWTTNEYIPQGSHGLESGTMMESGFKEIDFIASNVAGGLIKDVLS